MSDPEERRLIAMAPFRRTPRAQAPRRATDCFASSEALIPNGGARASGALNRRATPSPSGLLDFSQSLFSAPTLFRLLRQHAFEKPLHLRAYLAELRDRLDVETLPDYVADILPSAEAQHLQVVLGLLVDTPHHRVVADRHPSEEDPDAPDMVRKPCGRSVFNLRRLAEDGADRLPGRVPQVLAEGPRPLIHVKHAACAEAPEDGSAASDENVLGREVAVHDAGDLQLAACAEDVEQQGQAEGRRQALARTRLRGHACLLDHVIRDLTLARELQRPQKALEVAVADREGPAADVHDLEDGQDARGAQRGPGAWRGGDGGARGVVQLRAQAPEEIHSLGNADLAV
eukprot:CAMPEP_0170278408 /NCGR_PEP_ID=MMETSP0116_2-20130129/39208_1 /TAXON_ID=400756 /ORGANISM="Durinskia baltica, Strain CSIRO CS-38" /LENGTH=343 /DNA_ID=CAMNT_0010529719 /DNA_START=180 /DNA_END=1210 /DNA_ORIENTATION=-